MHVRIAFMKLGKSTRVARVDLLSLLIMEGRINKNFSLNSFPEFSAIFQQFPARWKSNLMT